MAQTLTSCYVCVTWSEGSVQCVARLKEKVWFVCLPRHTKGVTLKGMLMVAMMSPKYCSSTHVSEREITHVGHITEKTYVLRIMEGERG